jgi:hypothetical protein
MPGKFAALTLLVFIIFTSGGCALVVAGAGAGAYTYITGELIRAYPAGIEKTVRASVAALESLDIRIVSQSKSKATTTIKAKRKDGTPVEVKATMATAKISNVSVRCGLLGYWDKKISELIHVSIAQRLE